ncbi:AAA family ATPase [Patescibacteria group bacterium]|nr:AAA family ATPase [Patescibacteria group bacterium]MBU4057089.1 AAA family ATPase [Patescibacteria group bacterium]MBU4368467.1 AAA family ATPase [Patescibacteria group bacterium]
MKLIIVYGPPASGKLTVAKELSKITGYRVFHNHLTVDLAYSIFPSGTKAYSDLVEKIRLYTIESAAKNKVKGMIFTIVYGVETYGGQTDNLFIKKIIKKVKKYNGQVLFVKLSCTEKELQRRLKYPPRKAFKKINDVKIINSIKKKFNLDTVIPFVENQIIDNTSLSPQKVARMIKSHYKL